MQMELFLSHLILNFGHPPISFPNSSLLFSLNQEVGSFSYYKINLKFIYKYLQKSNCTSIFNRFIFRNSFSNKIFSRRDYRLDLLISLNMSIFHSLPKFFHYIEIWELRRSILYIFLLLLIHIIFMFSKFTLCLLSIHFTLLLICEILIVTCRPIVLGFLNFLWAKLLILIIEL